MTVFKACIKIAKSKCSITLLYLLIFTALLIGFQKSDSSHSEDMFQDRSVKIGIIDEDQGPLAKGLYHYLSKNNQVSYEKNDTSVLQEKMYYRDLEYLIWIPENFVENCLQGTNSLKVMAIPEEMTGSYMASKVNSYMSSAKLFYNAGFSIDEIVENIDQYEKPEILYSHPKTNTGYQTFQIGMVFLPYILMGILFFTFSSILITFNQSTLQQRCQAAPLTPTKKSIQMLLALSLYSFLLWSIIILVELLIFGKTFLKTPHLMYYVMNAFVLLIVVMSLAYLIGSSIKNINSTSVVINVVSLSMSFLCGVFVNLELLPTKVIKIAMFLPIYWYEKSCQLLRTYGTLNSGMKINFYKYQGIQLLFAIAFIMIALVIVKNRRILSRH